MNIQNTKQLIESIPSDVTLVAVTKNQTIKDVTALYDLEISDFGENKLQELLKKQAIFPDVRWHFIGRIQSNKIKQIVNCSYLIHSVSEIRYLDKINSEASKINKVQKVLLQLNLANEETKKGISLEDFNEVINNSNSYSNVEICGLMVMGNHVDNAAIIKTTFDQANSLFKDIYKSNPNFNTLSMGMSNDYQLAIESGSNMIRLGTVLFKD